MEEEVISTPVAGRSSALWLFSVGFIALLIGAAGMYFGKDYLSGEPERTLVKMDGLIRNCERFEDYSGDKGSENWYKLAESDRYVLITDTDPYSGDNESGLDKCLVSYIGEVSIYDKQDGTALDLTGEALFSENVFMQDLAYGDSIGEDFVYFESFGLEYSDFYIISLVEQTVTKVGVVKVPYYEAGGKVLSGGEDNIIFEKRSGPDRPWGEGENGASSISSLNLDTMRIADLQPADATHDYHLLGYSFGGEEIYIEEASIKDKDDWDDLTKVEYSILSITVD